MERPKGPSIVIEECRAKDGCSHSLTGEGYLSPALERAIAPYRNLPQARTSGTRPHPFKVVISHCPNGCSRPQIGDIGIMAASVPLITEEACTQCQACVTACLEGAIPKAGHEGPRITDACLYCGDCVTACPTGTLRASKVRYRILLGGKLGRHPRLGEDLGHLFTEEEVYEVISATLEAFIHAGGLMRLGSFIAQEGLSWLPEKYIPPGEGRRDL